MNKGALTFLDVVKVTGGVLAAGVALLGILAAFGLRPVDVIGRVRADADARAAERLARTQNTEAITRLTLNVDRLTNRIDAYVVASGETHADFRERLVEIEVRLGMRDKVKGVKP